MITARQQWSGKDVDSNNRRIPPGEQGSSPPLLKHQAPEVLLSTGSDQFVPRTDIVEQGISPSSSQDFFGLRSRRRSSAPAILSPANHNHHCIVTFLPYSIQIPSFDAYDAPRSAGSSKSNGVGSGSGSRVDTADNYEPISDDFDIPIRLKRPSSTMTATTSAPVPVLKHWKRIGWTAGYGMSEPTIQTSHLTVNVTASKAVDHVNFISSQSHNLGTESSHVIGQNNDSNDHGPHISWQESLHSETLREHVQRESKLLLVTNLKDQNESAQQDATVRRTRRIKTKLRSWTWEESSETGEPSRGKQASTKASAHLAVSESAMVENDTYLTEISDSLPVPENPADDDAASDIWRASSVDGATIPRQTWNISSDLSDGIEEDQPLNSSIHSHSSSWHTTSEEEDEGTPFFPRKKSVDAKASTSVPLTTSSVRKPSGVPLVMMHFRHHRDSVELYHRRMQRFSAGRTLHGARITKKKQVVSAEVLDETMNKGTTDGIKTNHF